MEIIIGNRKIGLKYFPYFIADIAANHDGDINRALRLIELAKEAGADAAKFQNFKAEKIVSDVGFKQLGQMSHQKEWKKSVFETYQDASIPLDWTPLLKKKCDEVGIEYFTSAYDFEAVDAVENYVNCYKVGSGDITWTNMLEYIAKKGKPVLLATGASNFSDVSRAVTVINNYNHKIIIMQCNTNYTATIENFEHINLNVLNSFKHDYPNVILGLSDHTKGYTTVLGAIALGARVIEKHFTDDDNRNGPDHHFSMVPIEWKQMVKVSSELFASLGDGIKKIEKNEEQTFKMQRRSIYMCKPKMKGEHLYDNDIIMLRPYNEDGFAPYEVDLVLGKKCKNEIPENSLIRRGDICD
jgi:N-acetylneuraminate synthase